MQSDVLIDRPRNVRLPRVNSFHDVETHTHGWLVDYMGGSSICYRQDVGYIHLEPEDKLASMTPAFSYARVSGLNLHASDHARNVLNQRLKWESEEH